LEYEDLDLDDEDVDGKSCTRCGEVGDEGVIGHIHEACLSQALVEHLEAIGYRWVQTRHLYAARELARGRTLTDVAGEVGASRQTVKRWISQR
jgi:hypothetical protein